MRLYTFCNYYLSSIQQGIQTAHVVHDLFNKYPTADLGSHEHEGQMLNIWSRDHKTIVVLNGGNSATLTDLVSFFDRGDHRFPYQCFCEDEQSLNSALTCVGIVLPERIYEAAARIRSRECVFINAFDEADEECFAVSYVRSDLFDPEQKTELVTPFEKELIERLNICGLAK